MTGPDAAAPILIGCAHGTRDPVGRAVVRGLLDDIRAARPGLDVRAAFVDVQTPEIDEVVAGVPDGRAAVVVPLLLSAGFHVQVDIARAIRQRPGSVVAAPTVGPDKRLVGLLLDRLAEAGARAGDAVVLVPAGSSDARAGAQADAMLREAWSGPPVVGFAAAGAPLAPEAVAVTESRSHPTRVSSSSSWTGTTPALRCSRATRGMRAPSGRSASATRVRRPGRASAYRQPPESGKMESC